MHANLGGTSGNGLTVSISNIANIPVLAMEKYLGTNVVYRIAGAWVVQTF